jgi:hypothetical protein
LPHPAITRMAAADDRQRPGYMLTSD